MGLADVVQEREEPIQGALEEGIIKNQIQGRYEHLCAQNTASLTEVGFTEETIQHKKFLNLRYEGTDTSIMIEHEAIWTGESHYETAFKQQHQTEFGFNFLARQILIDNVRVRSVGRTKTIHAEKVARMAENEKPEVVGETEVYFDVDG